jgi:hypothetical protein
MRTTTRNLMLLVLSPLTAVSFMSLVANPATNSNTATVAAANSGPWE